MVHVPMNAILMPSVSVLDCTQLHIKAPSSPSSQTSAQSNLVYLNFFLQVIYTQF